MLEVVVGFTVKKQMKKDDNLIIKLWPLLGFLIIL